MSKQLDDLKYDLRKAKAHRKECRERLAAGVMPEWVDFLKANIKAAQENITNLEYRISEAK